MNQRAPQPGFASQIAILKYVNDQSISASVESALQQYRVLENARIHVDTFAGGVELSGWVDSVMQSQLAVTLAADVGGVVYVVNNLRQRMPPEWLKTAP